MPLMSHRLRANRYRWSRVNNANDVATDNRSQVHILQTISFVFLEFFDVFVCPREWLLRVYLDNEPHSDHLLYRHTILRMRIANFCVTIEALIRWASWANAVVFPMDLRDGGTFVWHVFLRNRIVNRSISNVLKQWAG